MAKTIKFNLICDDKPIRTLEDLQDNFSIEDVLKYYNNGLLLRWLNVRGYDDEYKKVSDIKTEDCLTIVKELIRIFGVEADAKKLEENIYMLKYLDERKVLCEEYERRKYKTNQVIDDYRTGYTQLTDSIIQNPNDVALIKSNIAELMENYKWVMDLDHRELYWKLEKISPLAIMCLLMNDAARAYFLPMKVESDSDTSTTVLDIEVDTDKAEMFGSICNLIHSHDFKEKLGENLNVFSGITDGYWKDLETKGKKYMIISMGSGDFVRGAGVQGGDLSSSDILNNFVIVEGIDYKSNSSTRELLYMEV